MSRVWCNIDSTAVTREVSSLRVALALVVISITIVANPAGLSPSAITPRAVALSVGTLEPGDYTIEITVTVEGQLPVTTSRRIQVR